MEAQVHILCSHCEKVLVEVQKEKMKADEVINVEEGQLLKNQKCIKKESSLDFKSESQEELDESSLREIKIDYSKNEMSGLGEKVGAENQFKMTQQGSGFIKRKFPGTCRRLELVIVKLKMIRRYKMVK